MLAILNIRWQSYLKVASLSFHLNHPDAEYSKASSILSSFSNGEGAPSISESVSSSATVSTNNWTTLVSGFLDIPSTKVFNSSADPMKAPGPILTKRLEIFPLNDL